MTIAHETVAIPGSDARGHVSKALTDDPLHSAVLRIAARLEPTMRRQFLAAAESARQAVDLESLAAAIAGGQLTAAESRARLDVLERELHAETATIIRTGFTRAAEAAASQLTEGGVPIGASLDRVNARSADWARRASGALITEITTETRQAIQRIISDAFTNGIPPRTAARQIRSLIGLTERQAVAVEAARARLVEAGIAEAVVERRMERLANAYVRRRAETIARTEILTAAHEGQRLLWQQAKNLGYLDPRTTHRVWIVTDDDRLDPECEALDDAEADLDGPFPGGSMGPPLHPQCRCDTVLRFGDHD